MTLTILDLVTSDTALRRDRIRNTLGRKTATEIRTWAGDQDERAWALTVAGRLAVSGFLTLADVTDDEFDTIVA